MTRKHLKNVLDRYVVTYYSGSPYMVPPHLVEICRQRCYQCAKTFFESGLFARYLYPVVITEIIDEHIANVLEVPRIALQHMHMKPIFLPETWKGPIEV